MEKAEDKRKINTKPKSPSSVQSNGYNPSYPKHLDNSLKFQNLDNSAMRIDPYKHKERYLRWKSNSDSHIPQISATNALVLKDYLRDMENGFNVSSLTKKGARSFIRLNTIRTRITFFMRQLEGLYKLDNILDVNEYQICSFLADMRTGKITKLDGSQYQSTKDFVRDFKAFWHWHQKVSKKKGIEVPDITQDLDSSGDKPRWVYLTEEQIRSLAESAKPVYRTMILFLFDSGIRAPTELLNIKISDFHNDFKELQIREETSKTFGRRIKLMICSEVVKKYVKDNALKETDFLFTLKPYAINRYLGKLSSRLFGDKLSPAGQKYSDLTMYDLRHCSCCYWLPRYKSESALKYRFGWKKSDKIHYYSELLGMKDTINEEDMLIDVTKTEIEKEMTLTKKQNEILQEKQRITDLQLTQIMMLVRQLEKQIMNNSIIIQKYEE
jgi:hypothetical protein